MNVVGISLAHLLFLGFGTIVLGQPPQTNPYLERYHIGDHWTSELAWGNVVNIRNIEGLVKKDGSVDSVLFYESLESLHDSGGGVLYFPKGEYYFDYDLNLLSGVILRGEAYGAKNATDSDFSPPSKLTFPKFKFSPKDSSNSSNDAFRKITFRSNGLKNCGLVDLDINRGAIDFFYHKDNVNDNIIIFGVRQNNVALPNEFIPSQVQIDEGREWQMWPAWWLENMVVGVSENCLISNCRINDSVTDDFAQFNYMTDDGDVFTDSIYYDYSYHEGINVFKKEETGRVEIRDNYIVSSSEFHKIFADGPNIVVKDNELIDSVDKNHGLINKDGRLSRRLMTRANELFQIKSTTLDDSVEVFYHLLSPKTIGKKEKYPLVVFFHGTGEWGKGANKLIHFVSLFAKTENYNDYPCFVLVPHGFEGDQWSSGLSNPMTESAKYAVELVRKFQNEKHIDKNRTFLTGVSSGGYATWELLLRYPKMFSAAVPISSIQSFTPEELKVLKKVRIWLSTGTVDEHIPIEYTRLMRHNLILAGIKDLHYKEYKDVGHFGWVPLFFDPEFLPWLFSE